MTFRFKSHASQTPGLLLLLIALVLISSASFGQRPQAQVKYKGIWEPVSYPEDVKWFDVFFATADEGWVAGGANDIAGGLIIHTSDGGDHWDVQYGDPQSSDRAVTKLRFLDQTHGWAVQGTGGSGSKLLHTRDGKLWLLAGTIDVYTMDYMFTSETHGVQISRDVIRATQDGGRSWQPVFNCAAKIQINGLWRNVNCQFQRLQFVTPNIAYVVAKTLDAPKNIFLAKTTDGGSSWTMSSQELTGYSEDVFFFDESTGYIRAGSPASGQIYKTTDGGQNWIGMAASPGERLQFADPEVGWSLLYTKVSFTTDGGDHWNSRQYAFPAQGHAFSLPRRDRGYVAGDHGMIYRYRLVPEPYTAKGMLPAPLLSGIDSPLDAYVQRLAVQVNKLSADAGLAPVNLAQSAATTAGLQSTDTNAAAGGFTQNTDPNLLTTGNTQPASGSATTTGAFTQDTTAVGGSGNGFVQDVGQAQTVLNSVNTEAPRFATKYRNLNLLLVGFQVATQMPAQLQGLQQSFSALKNLKDPSSTTATLTDVQTKVANLMQIVRTAFQKR